MAKRTKKAVFKGAPLGLRAADHLAGASSTAAHMVSLTDPMRTVCTVMIHCAYAICHEIRLLRKTIKKARK